LDSLVLGNGPRLVLLHGFTQNRGCWGPLPELLASDHEVVLVDGPGHGTSGHDDADLVESGRLVGQVGGRAIYVGYSMGGRMALHLALAQPDLVEQLILVGATAGIDDAVERTQRRNADEALAARLLDIGLPAFLDEWLASPLFATLPEAAACRQARLSNRPEGLAASLRSVGTGTQQPLWDRIGSLTMPVWVVAGVDDTKFTAQAHRLASAIGANAEVRIEPGGHALHLEHPAAFAALVREVTTSGRPGGS
jgi:2-succinyl-6-hydroxy-2,4-cyclohexadiene-1-carboxylate synthase